MKYKSIFLSTLVLGGFFLIFPLQSLAVYRECDPTNPGCGIFKGGNDTREEAIPLGGWRNRTMDWLRGGRGIKLPPRTSTPTDKLPDCDKYPPPSNSQKTGVAIGKEYVCGLIKLGKARDNPDTPENQKVLEEHRACVSQLSKERQASIISKYFNILKECAERLCRK